MSNKPNPVIGRRPKLYLELLEERMVLSNFGSPVQVQGQIPSISQSWQSDAALIQVAGSPDAASNNGAALDAIGEIQILTDGLLLQQQAGNSNEGDSTSPLDTIDLNQSTATNTSTDLGSDTTSSTAADFNQTTSTDAVVGQSAALSNDATGFVDLTLADSQVADPQNGAAADVNSVSVDAGWTTALGQRLECTVSHELLGQPLKELGQISDQTLVDQVSWAPSGLEVVADSLSGCDGSHGKEQTHTIIAPPLVARKLNPLSPALPHNQHTLVPEFMVKVGTAANDQAVPAPAVYGNHSHAEDRPKGGEETVRNCPPDVVDVTVLQATEDFPIPIPASNIRSFSPLGSDLFTGSFPIDRQTIDCVVQEFVNKLLQVGQEMSRSADGTSLSAWLVTMTLATTAYEVGRHHRRGGRAWGSIAMADKLSTLTWCAGLPGYSNKAQ
jgi:hypothetical protein